jgi:hypothetical protein
MFNPRAYGEEVARILEFDGGGRRLMPLTSHECSSRPAHELLRQTTALNLFPGARAPEAAMAGLYLYFSCWDDAHRLAQDIDTAEGSYWHGIVHRQEPDPGNAAYWFRRVGAHAIFPALRERAVSLGMPLGARWDPLAFIEICERARRQTGSELEKQALQVQLAEWQLLFDYCAGRPTGDQ